MEVAMIRLTTPDSTMVLNVLSSTVEEKMEVVIREEESDDFREVECVVREAFWNLYVPGCNEHYLLHVMRDHPDFLAELSMVAVHSKKIVGQIAYTKSFLTTEGDLKLDSITFGPVSVLPEYQGKGIASQLIEQSMEKAKHLGHTVIAIGGQPHHYCKHGFRNGRDIGISDRDGKYPYGLLAIELVSGVLKGKIWKYFESEVYSADDKAVEEYDKQFEPKKKEFRPSQEEFSIAIRAYLE
jgi:putative acetyltransferase